MTSEKLFNAYFVDLFVRVSNLLAIQMYTAFDYSVYRVVLGNVYVLARVLLSVFKYC